MAEMTEEQRRAQEISAKKVGIRPDQVAAAVNEYRSAIESIGVEPEWRAICHMSGRNLGIAQYGAEDTRITLEIHSYKSRGDEWKEDRIYAFDGKAYELYGEARAVELAKDARPSPHGLPATPTSLERDDG